MISIHTQNRHDHRPTLHVSFQSLCIALTHSFYNASSISRLINAHICITWHMLPERNSEPYSPPEVYFSVASTTGIWSITIQVLIALLQPWDLSFWPVFSGQDIMRGCHRAGWTQPCVMSLHAFHSHTIYRSRGDLETKRSTR